MKARPKHSDNRYYRLVFRLKGKTSPFTGSFVCFCFCKSVNFENNDYPHDPQMKVIRSLRSAARHAAPTTAARPYTSPAIPFSTKRLANVTTRRNAATLSVQKSISAGDDEPGYEEELSIFDRIDEIRNSREKDYLHRLQIALSDDRLLEAVQLARRYIQKIPSSSSLSSSSKSTCEAYEDLFDILLADDQFMNPTYIRVLENIVNDLRLNVVGHNTVLKLARLALTYKEYIPVICGFSTRDIGDMPDSAWIFRQLIHLKIPYKSIVDLFHERMKQDPDISREWHSGIWASLIDIADYDAAMSMLNMYEQSTKTRRPPGAWKGGPGLSAKVAKPYQIVVAKWIKESTRAGSTIKKAGSDIPRTLAKGLSSIIGQKMLPTDFLNQWMNAERIAQNYATGEIIWDSFDRHFLYGEDEIKEAEAIRAKNKEKGLEHKLAADDRRIRLLRSLYTRSKDRARTNTESYRIYFKLYPNLVAPPPLREVVETMLVHTYWEDISTKLLNSLLSAVISKTTTEGMIDLPLFYMVLSMYHSDPSATGSYWGPEPDKRTLGLATAGIARLSRSVKQSISLRENPEAIVRPLSVTRGFPGCGPLSLALHPDEWKWMDNLVASVVREQTREKAKEGVGEFAMEDQETLDNVILGSSLAGNYGFTRTLKGQLTQRRPTKRKGPAPIESSVEDANPFQQALSRLDEKEQVQLNEYRQIKLLSALKVILNRMIKQMIIERHRGEDRDQIDKLYLYSIEKAWIDTGYTGPGLPPQSTLLEERHKLGELPVRRKKTSEGRVKSKDRAVPTRDLIVPVLKGSLGIVDSVDEAQIEEMKDLYLSKRVKQLEHIATRIKGFAPTEETPEDAMVSEDNVKAG